MVRRLKLLRKLEFVHGHLPPHKLEECQARDKEVAHRQVKQEDLDGGHSGLAGPGRISLKTSERIMKFGATASERLSTRLYIG